MSTIHEGDKVRCKRGNIEKNLGQGLVGTVKGFARYSPYHGREVFVDFGHSHPANGWFWLCHVEPVAEETKAA